MWQHNLFLLWIDSSCAFDFRLCLVAFDFYEKLKQSIVQMTM